MREEQSITNLACPKDSTFSYPLDLEPASAAYHYRLAEMVRVILRELLEIAVPLSKGQAAKVDGFEWIHGRGGTYDVFSSTEHRTEDNHGRKVDDHFHDPANAAFYEPRIEFIKKTLESLLSIVDLENDGAPVRVGSFRLKDMADWLEPSPGDPSEVFEYAAGHCTCDCVFCCNKGNPPSVAAGGESNRTAGSELEEIWTRARYFAPEAGNALFRSTGAIYDVLASPAGLEALRLSRDKSVRPLRITSNGNTLYPETIRELAGLKPMYVYLSINSSSAERRRALMRDPRPDVAIDAPRLLSENAIPYAAVIVPWPLRGVDDMLEDLDRTVDFVGRYQPHMIQVNLPGYSKYAFPERPFDTEEVWPAIVSRVRLLRERFDFPVVAMPVLYESNLHVPRKNEALVLGVVQHSPADIAGVRRGDRVVEVDGVAIRCLPQGRDLLHAVRTSGKTTWALRLRRGNLAVESGLDDAKWSYPYSPDIDEYFGIMFAGSGLRTRYLEDLQAIAESRGARRVLFLSSQLMRPTFEECLQESGLFGSDFKIDIAVPTNGYFGGNICMGDLLVVQDFIDCIEKHVADVGAPDLVVIPSSPFNLSGWGRDLTGRTYLDIERATGLPIALLPCDTIYS